MNAAQLAACTGAKVQLALRWLPHITAAMAEFGIDTPQRQAMFLAQIGHESGGLYYTKELWGPTPAQKTYEGRVNLGNTEPGDGYRFCGRGLIQTTGRYNYLTTGQALGLDLVAYPELLEEQPHAARSAAWFWQSHALNAFADDCDNVGCTKRINGGTNGLADRQARYVAAQLALAGEVVDVPVAAPLPAPVAPAAAASGLGALLLGLIKLFFRKKP